MATQNFVDKYRGLAGWMDNTIQKAQQIESSKTPEQKFIDAYNAYNYYQNQSKNAGGVIGAMRNIGAVDQTELSLRNQLIDAYNGYNNWLKEQDGQSKLSDDQIKNIQNAISGVYNSYKNWKSYRDLEAQDRRTNSMKTNLTDESLPNSAIFKMPGLNDEPSDLTITSSGIKLKEALRKNSELQTGLIDTENELVKPQNAADFVKNYRETTKKLGARANTNRIDAETKSIMNKLWLPTYYDALSDEDISKIKAAYEENPDATANRYRKMWDSWNEDNYKYRVRAAQVLKNVSKEKRQKIYDLLNMDPMSGKAELDKLIQKQQNVENKAITKIASPFIKAIRSINPEVADAIDNAFKGKDDSTSSSTKESTSKDTSKSTETTTNPEDVITYTYKKGDTFGQVIKDLGLKTENGLWGPNGDVEYYTKQLMDQGIWPNGQRGNIPIGTTIKLTRRK